MFLSAKRFVIRVGGYLIDAVGHVAMKIYPLRVYRELASEIQINGDWTEIVPPAPMKIKRRFQSVDLKIEGARLWLDAGKIQLPDGRTIAPELQIQGADEHWHDLMSGRYGLSVSNFDTENDVAEISSASFSVKADQKEYLKVRIRSDEPFSCSKVIWRNFTLK